MHSLKCARRILVAKTCRKCGELKMSSEFKTRNDGLYESLCAPCHYKLAKRLQRESNNASLEKATQHRDIWSSDQIAMLWTLHAQGLSNRQIGERLGRTEEAVAQRKVRSQQERTSDISLNYMDTSGVVHVVGKPYAIFKKGWKYRLNKACQELAELHSQLIFFLSSEDESTEEWKEVTAWDCKESTS